MIRETAVKVEILSNSKRKLEKIRFYTEGTQRSGNF